MKVRKKVPKGKTEKLVELGKVGVGNVFRFHGTKFEDALSGNEGDEQAFYMVISTKAEKTGRVTVCSLDGKGVLERDASRPVHPHSGEIIIGEPQMEKEQS